MGQLRFLEIGHDIDLGQRHQRHQARARRHELALHHGLVPNAAVDGGADRGGVQIDIGGVKLGLAALSLRGGLSGLRLDAGDAALLGLDGGFWARTCAAD
jgi:hypothetical protein